MAECQTAERPLPAPVWREIFREPYARYSAEQLLAHYRKRKTVKFFPVLEADQTSTDFISAVLRNRFTFNNETHEFGATVDWLNNPSEDIEWQIMLHKGYYLTGLMQHFSRTGDSVYLQKWIELTDSWIGQIDDPGFIATDVTGRRIQNWIHAFYYLLDADAHPAIAEDFLLRFLASLQRQVAYLIDNLTPARNHRTLELYAVFLAAVVFPEFIHAGHWLSISRQALAVNADMDILADGAHCELSTFYHHIVLKNLLAVKRLATANDITMPARFDAAMCRALDFSAFIHKPDGQIPSLSDGDSDSFLGLLQQGYDLYGGEQLRYVFTHGNAGVPLEAEARAFPDSGYYVLRSAWRNNTESFQDARYLVFDCGPLGAGNHGHLDLLNIEVAAHGRSLVVDPGRYTYDESGDINWRVLFRSTRYHNTVEVDGKNQTAYHYSEGKGKYAISGPHAEAQLLCLQSGRRCHLLHGRVRSHEYSAVHERKIFFASDEYWLIWDILRDDQPHRYVLRYHLAAVARDRTRIRREAHAIIVEAPGLLLMQPSARHTDVSIAPGFIAAVYGKKTPAPIVEFQRQSDNSVFETLLYPYRRQRPVIAWQGIAAEISGNRQDTGNASAFLLEIASDAGTFRDLFFVAHDGHPRRWRYQQIDCSGCFCYLRLNSAGIVENYFTGPGSRIVFAGKPLTGPTGAP